MAGLAASRRRPFNTRGRPGATPGSGPVVAGPPAAPAASEPPPKKRRYIPGGPGGGGRYVEIDGTETPVFANRDKKKERERQRASDRDRGHAHSAPRPRRGERSFGLGLDGAGPDTPTLASGRSRRETRRENPPATSTQPRPRYSSAAAATAAMVQGDGFKPREERGWEEFHQELEIEMDMPCFDSEDVDGIVKPTTPGLANGVAENSDSSAMPNGDAPTLLEDIAFTPPPKRRGPGRPPRRPMSLLKGIGTPDGPKLIPLPAPNPRERLTLPKPSFRRVNPFESYERAGGSQDYVDKQMASMGYQESEIFNRPPFFIRTEEGGVDDDIDVPAGVNLDGEGDKSVAATTVKRVEYDMDEQDQKFLEEYNRHRKGEDVEAIKPAVFEVIMSFIEKEWHALEKRIPKPNPKPPQTHRPRSSSAAAVNGEPPGEGEEQDSKCAICDDGDCENTNAIVFCDGCDLAVHQECYGVPFIPEGQWLCRKCRVIGSGVPTCIFCPNMDGAFKQTNSSKWAHLLCAIWIPEVSLGNSTFMEPVMDVEKVPRPRWKLTCTICNQKMGACIQCGNKNCFRAFHVTCARRAKWCLQMKSSHGGPASLDASVLKAFCDKHVPAEWADANDVAAATAETVNYYKYAMKGKVWANNQTMQSMQAYPPRHDTLMQSVEEPLPKINLIVKDDKGKKKKLNHPPKSMWRLPSGAPVIPSVVYESVENLLGRMTIRKRKDFASDMCRYWTLKREVRRGAPLIKRLQLQMEMFSSMEITRRDFAAMGAAGGLRLQRRKSFTQLLQQDSDHLKQLTEFVIQKQQAVVDDDGTLDTILDIIYFPVVPLLRPIAKKAITLNGKGFFREGLLQLLDQVEQRYYVSTYQFANDFAMVFANVISTPPTLPSIIHDAEPFDETAWRASAILEQKEKRKLAKRIMKAVEPLLKDALRNEADLLKKPSEEMPEPNLMEMGLPANDPPLPTIEETVALARPETTVNGDQHAAQEDGTTQGTEDKMELDQEPTVSVVVPAADAEEKKQPSPPSHPTPAASATSNVADSSSFPLPSVAEPPTPPLSHASASSAWNALAYGGTPWYMNAFSPDGTTIYEEKWSGRDVAREMSEELSDMEEDELNGLVEPAAQEPEPAKPTAKAAAKNSKKAKAKKRRAGFR